MAGGDAEGTLVAALDVLADEVRALHLPLPTPRAQAGTAEAWALQRQLDDYVLPRLRRLDAPVLAVVGGPTGAGKSTLVNTLLGRAVTSSGVLRPTTRTPVLAHHPDDAHWFTGDRVLRDLARVHGGDGTGSGHELVLVADDAVPQGLAVVDAPDLDSVVRQNRALAEQLLAAADLWLFVTSAARYADAVPWAALHGAARRGVAVAVVLDRVAPEAADVVRADLQRLLQAAALQEAPLFLVPEAAVVGGRLPDAAVAPLRAWLTALVEDAAARAGVVRRTVRGAVLDVVRRTEGLVEVAAEQDVTRARLVGLVDEQVDVAAAAVRHATADGTLLRGEVLSRWQELVGAGDLARAVDAFVGRVGERLTAFVRGRPPVEAAAAEAIEVGLDALLRGAADDAAARTEQAWRADPTGAVLLAGDDLGRAGPDVPALVAREVRAWQTGVLELVREVGMAKRGTARALAFGVNGLGVALMVVTFASTGGVTGAEVGIAAGTAVVGQRVLEAVFGEAAVRRLVQQARDDLDARVRAVLRQDAERFHERLELLQPTSGAAERLATAAAEVAAAVTALDAAGREDAS
jgi:energy-coupling factor transporter ATP-binding protein EcfA2